MKTFLLTLVSLAVVLTARAFSNSSPSSTTRTITVPGSAYDLNLDINWTCDDAPQRGARGMAELLDSSGMQVAAVWGLVSRSAGPGFSTSGAGSVSNVNWWMAVWSADSTPADGDLTFTWSVTGLAPGTYTLRIWNYTTYDTLLRATTVWTSTYFTGGSAPGAPPVNSPPTVTLDSPGDQTVAVGTALTISSHATDPDGNITSHNLDIQRPVGDWNYQGGFATGEPFQGGPVGNAGDSTRGAAFTFTDVGTYYVRAAADDGSGWVHSATVAVTVVAAAPTKFSLATAAGMGGSVSPGGVFDAGTSVNVSAIPDVSHDFTGWSGDASGGSNPLSITLDRDKTVQANFAPRMMALVTSATVGGSVTPGGSYPYGTAVTISAAPDAAHRFVGWAGDANGAASSLLLTLTNPYNVQAVFTDKAAQIISFTVPATIPAGPGAIALNGSASSGLPVDYTVVSGPATISGDQLTITGPGVVTVRADQPGDGAFLPAPAVARTFNAVSAALLKYRLVGRTIFHDSRSLQPIVLQLP